MKEVFDFKDKNRIFNEMNNMHDLKISSLKVDEKKITLQFNELLNSSYSTCSIDYFINKNEGVDFLAKKTGSNKEIFYFDEYEKINSFCDNAEMLMFKFSIDSLNHMELELILTKKKKSYNICLYFAPTKIVYNWKTK